MAAVATGTLPKKPSIKERLGRPYKNAKEKFVEFLNKSPRRKKYLKLAAKYSFIGFALKGAAYTAIGGAVIVNHYYDKQKGETAPTALEKAYSTEEDDEIKTIE